MKSVPRNVKTVEEKEAKKATDPAGGGDGGGTRFHGSLFITLDGRPYIFPFADIISIYLAKCLPYSGSRLSRSCYIQLLLLRTLFCFFSREGSILTPIVKTDP